MTRRLLVLGAGLIVAALACSDDDISPDEFCSPSPCACRAERTIELHVTNLFRKSRCENRATLTALVWGGA